jgi:hypothetical protein
MPVSRKTENAKNGARVVHADEEVHSYWNESKRPLNILAFLAPFIVFYEVGLIFVLREDRGTITNLAHEWIIEFMRPYIGLQGLWLPGLAVVVVLLIWHVLTREPWSVNFRALPVMLVEAVLLMVPLLVASHIVRKALPLVGQEDAIISALGPTGRIAVSIGAGLYEELVFRMLVVFVIHTLMVDFLRFSSLVGSAVAIAISAVLFTLYHPVWGADGTALMGRMVFYFVAGIWFGVLYVARGFGVVVAVHAFYDIAVLLEWD